MGTQALVEQIANSSRELLDHIRCIRAGRSLREYFRYTWPLVDPAPLAEGFYVDAIADHLEAVLNGEIRHLGINIRPKLGKSTLCMVLFPSYVWASKKKGPLYGQAVKFFTTSYSDDYCIRDAMKAKWLIESPWYQERWKVPLRRDQSEKSMYYNQAGGYRVAVPIRGQITGAGGDIVMVDDPLSYLQSFSAADRDKVYELLNGAVMQQRIQPDASPVIWIGQRLHVDDPFGRFLKDADNAATMDLLCLQTIRRFFQVPLRYHTFFDYDAGREITREVPSSGATSTVLSRTGRFADPRKEGECIAPSRIPPREIARARRMTSIWEAQDMQNPLESTDGRFFQGFSPVASLCEASDVVSLDPEDLWEFWLGGDHGDGKGKEVVPLIAVHRQLRKAVIIDGYISSGESTPERDAHMIRALLKRNALTLGRLSGFVADINASFKADGRTINAILSDLLDGIQIDTPDKRKGTVDTGELLMNLAFQNAHLLVDKDFAEALEAFGRYNKKSVMFKDLVDACRYVLYPILKEWIHGEAKAECD